MNQLISREECSVNNLICIVSPQSVPLPFKSLLVHEKYMTETLENHFKTQIRINVQNCVVNQNSLTRTVILKNEEQTPLVLAAIVIKLDNLPNSAVINEVKELKKPFGRILREAGYTYQSKEKVYFYVCGFSRENKGGKFWGRKSKMIVNDKVVAIVAEIVAFS